MSNNKRKSNATGIAFLILPYISVLIAAVLVAVFIFVYVTSSGLVQLVVNKVPPNTNMNSHLTASVITDGDDTEMPVIRYESQWATLNVDGWENINIPVFFGDTNAVLSVGAGMPMHAQFCGRGGRVVLDAHVTTFFNEIEKTKIGTKIRVSTIYGNYVYMVERVAVFDDHDTQYILPDQSKEELVMYTCYPYDNDYRPRTQRIALICSLVEGKEWVK